MLNMREMIYGVMGSLVKSIDDYGDGITLRFREGGKVLGVVRYGISNGRPIMVNGDIYGLMDRINGDVNLMECDVYEVDKIVKDYCYEYVVGTLKK